MSIKVAIIGAGSLTFTRTLVTDLLCVPEFRETEFHLWDIDAEYLDHAVQLVGRDVSEAKLPAKIIPAGSQREAIQDANYVMCFVRVGGLSMFETDVEIPLKYGVDQCVGDTLGPGGIMYGQRGIPVLLSICKDIREVAAPDALLLNYSNPMAILTWACAEFGGVNVVGLCHGVQHGHRQIAKVYGLEKKDVDIICAGINHQTWYIQARHGKRDLIPGLLEAFENHEEYSKTEKVRIDVMRRFGYYSTESNGHLSEYLPWYRKRLSEIEKWVDLSYWIHGETGGYLRVCREWRDHSMTYFDDLMKEPPRAIDPEQRSDEHGSYIIEGLETGRVYRGHFNRKNTGTISNLPADAIIEAPGYADRNGISMAIVGDLPLGCAAVCSQSISVQRLAVHAAVTGDDQLLRQAFLLDPLTGAVCNPPEVWQMVDEMLVAGKEYLPQYATAISAAEQRLAAGNLIPTMDGFKGAVRIPSQPVEKS
ncbi:MAG: alpha-glucosidase/alpha-galactosidase [Fimbriimonadaceae bacterium]|nr:alpha-glucosidase/alpha-galactosidase [Fimbriimonadaceae bacterium]